MLVSSCKEKNVFICDMNLERIPSIIRVGMKYLDRDELRKNK